MPHPAAWPFYFPKLPLPIPHSRLQVLPISAFSFQHWIAPQPPLSTFNQPPLRPHDRHQELLLSPTAASSSPQQHPRLRRRRRSIPRSASPCAKSPSRPPRPSAAKSKKTRPSASAYDCSGPWGDPAFITAPDEGLPALRAKVDPRPRRSRRVRRPPSEAPGQRLPLRKARRVRQQGRAEPPRRVPRPPRPAPPPPPRQARQGRFTQLAYARAGIITPEMEFIAIRENQKLASALKIADLSATISSATTSTNSTPHQQLLYLPPSDSQLQLSTRKQLHAASVFARFPQRIPKEITAESSSAA